MRASTGTPLPSERGSGPGMIQVAMGQILARYRGAQPLGLAAGIDQGGEPVRCAR